MSESKPLKDPEQAELELKMAKDIQAMPAAVQPRFKACHLLYDQVNQIDEEEDREYRELERKYEVLYQAVYEKRLALLSGDKAAVDPALIEKFDQRREVMQDAKYAELEVAVCDVKDIQNTPLGVSGFWLKAMLADKEIAMAVHEKDRAILGYLQNVTLDLHAAPCFGYTLSFHFEKNSYFKELVLRKSFKMAQQNVIESCEGTPITWAPGCDVTKAKKKKGKGAKKKTVTVKCDSFFNFFESIDVSKKPEGAESDEDGDEQAEQMDADFELGNSIKDDLIPLALEYYLGVIDQGDSDSEGDEDDDSDESDEAPKKKSKKATPSASSQATDEQKQECKQQ